MKLWQLLIVISVVGLTLGLLPQRIGIPALVVVEGFLIIALVGLFGADLVRKARKK